MFLVTINMSKFCFNSSKKIIISSIITMISYLIFHSFFKLILFLIKKNVIIYLILSARDAEWHETAKHKRLSSLDSPPHLRDFQLELNFILFPTF